MTPNENERGVAYSVWEEEAVLKSGSEGRYEKHAIQMMPPAILQ